MILNLINIKFRNFLSFGSNWQIFDLLEGINLITGLDKDNGRKNGVGKSALLDAIIFGLFGRTAKDIVQARIINWKNHKQCEVCISFMKDGGLYRIERGLKPNYLKIFKNDEEIDQLANKVDFQKWIEEEILQIDYDTFITLIYYNPTNQISLFNASKVQKRKLIETLFNLSDYSKVNINALDKIKSLDNKFNDLKISDTSLLSKISEQNQYIENNNEKINKLDKDQLNSLLNQIDKEIKKLSDTSNDAVICTNYELVLKRISKYINSYDSLKYARKIDGDISFTNIASLKLELEEIKNKNNALTEKMEQYKKDIDKKQFELKSLSSMIDKTYKINSNLKDNAPCPVCKTIVKISLVKEALEKEASPYLEKQLILKQELLDMDKNVQLITKQIDAGILRLDELEKEIEIYHHIRKYNTREKLKIVYSKYLEIKEKMDDIVKNNENLKNLLQKKEILLVKLNSLDAQIDQLKKENNQMQEKIKENKDLLTKNEEEERGILKLKAYFEYIREICKDENIKQYAISNLIPYIEQQANKYLSATGFNFYLKIDSFLDFEIKGPGISNSSYGNLSGGESKTINLALQMALLDICKAKSVNFPNILIFDELLDGAVDSKGLESMFEIIKHKQKENDLKVFVISHRQESQEINFDHIYMVIKENGFSRISDEYMQSM